MNFSAILKNKKSWILIAAFLLFMLGIVFYSRFAGILLIFSLLIFGIFSIVWKEKEIRILALIFLLLLSISNLAVNGAKFGIDFSGGTRIPITLEHAVDQTTMDQLVEIIKKRASFMGLSEASVKAVGNTEIYVEIPSSDESQISFVEEVLAHQGVFQGIVDGKVALEGDGIVPGSVGATSAAQLQGKADWGVSFALDTQSAKYFKEVVKGKAKYPLYMFLDRPQDAIIIISIEEIESNAPEDATVDDLVDPAKDALILEEGTIDVYLLEELDAKEPLVPKTNSTQAIVSKSTPEDKKELLENWGFTIKEIPDEQISPHFSGGNGVYWIEDWEAVGLLSSPVLEPSITEEDSQLSMFYSITGSSPGTGAEQIQNAKESTEKIESILKGGSLPVQISLGSRTVLPASLGTEFLRLSLIGIVGSLLVISILIGVRYRKLKLIVPIMIISFSELIILLSILGSFTIDLAAMAGILAAIGVGVDAQIVITDELLKKESGDKDTRLENALAIIKVNIVVAIVAMVPLLFSSLVEVIGFAISTILGALLGFLLSRPAYGAIVEDIIED